MCKNVNISLILDSNLPTAKQKLILGESSQKNSIHSSVFNVNHNGAVGSNERYNVYYDGHSGGCRVVTWDNAGHLVSVQFGWFVTMLGNGALACQVGNQYFIE